MKQIDKGLRAGVLVVGCGNTLRGDDAAGYEVARRVEEWGLPNVRGLAVHQLTPELAEEIAECEEVAFVDASKADRAVRIERMTRRTPASSAVAHSMAPAALLSFAHQLYGRSPRAWIIGIPAYSFEDADCITSSTRQSMEDVFIWLREKIRAQAKEYVSCMS